MVIELKVCVKQGVCGARCVKQDHDVTNGLLHGLSHVGSDPNGLTAFAQED